MDTEHLLGALRDLALEERKLRGIIPVIEAALMRHAECLERLPREQLVRALRVLGHGGRVEDAQQLLVITHQDVEHPEFTAAACACIRDLAATFASLGCRLLASAVEAS